MFALTACRFAFLARTQATRALLPIVPGTRNAAFATLAVNQTTAALIDSEWAVIDRSAVRADSYGLRPFVRLIGFHRPTDSLPASPTWPWRLYGQPSFVPRLSSL